MSKLHKVTFEYEDSIQTLEGEEADKWLADINSKIIFANLHRLKLAEYKWKIFKLNKDEQ